MRDKRIILNTLNSSKAAIIFVVIIIIVKLITTYTEKREDKTVKEPFWVGTKYMKVCKIPYDSTDECKNMAVTLIDNNSVRIRISESEYVYSYGLSCALAGRWIKETPQYVFCRSWDNEGQQWDLMPIWAYLPSYTDHSNYLIYTSTENYE